MTNRDDDDKTTELVEAIDQSFSKLEEEWDRRELMLAILTLVTRKLMAENEANRTAIKRIQMFAEEPPDMARALEQIHAIASERVEWASI